MPQPTLNPRIQSVSVGIRKLISVNIYPLAFGDELTLTNIGKEMFLNFTSLPEEEQNIESLINTIFQSLSENIDKMVALIIDRDEWEASWKTTYPDKPPCDFLKQVDNDQMLQIVEVVYKANFAEAEKKASG